MLTSKRRQNEIVNVNVIPLDLTHRKNHGYDVIRRDRKQWRVLTPPDVTGDGMVYAEVTLQDVTS